MRKIYSGTQRFLNKSPFLCFPIEQWRGYQRDSFFYGFLDVSSITIHSFRLLFWKMSQNCVSVHLMALCVFLMQKTEVAIFSTRSYWKKLCPGLQCFCGYYGANLEYALSWPQFPVDFSAKREELSEIFLATCYFSGKKEHLLSNWESRECWQFNLIAFLSFVTRFPAAS